MTQSEKLERMLLWFESNLPAHELGDWRFEAQAHPVPLLDESRGLRAFGSRSWGQLVGEARCLRCGMRVAVPPWGNFNLHSEEEDARLAIDYPTLTRAAKVDEAKRWMNAEAAQKGACWGDVPRPTQVQGAVLDSPAEFASR